MIHTYIVCTICIIKSDYYSDLMSEFSEFNRLGSDLSHGNIANFSYLC